VPRHAPRVEGATSIVWGLTPNSFLEFPQQSKGHEQPSRSHHHQSGHLPRKTTIRGLRYPVDMLLDLLAAGATTEEILADYADLEAADISALLAYALLPRSLVPLLQAEGCDTPICCRVCRSSFW
jgi:hypothetical protein